ncbi:hypothetical protein C8Q80DRAFT_1124729 [Daedaleopsis nitida]|nr:hypothetical protein C8Q80DRAFT_1124729 [Daedaleopsis nitida]
MSSPDPSEITAIIASYNSYIIGNYCTFAAGALLIYESAILFSRKVEVFWRCGITGTSILFLLGKYLALSKMILTWALYLPIFKDNTAIQERYPTHGRTAGRVQDDAPTCSQLASPPPPQLVSEDTMNR